MSVKILRENLSTYTLADITVTCNNGDLSSEHDISSTLYTIDE